ncbi:dihydroorotase [Terasakiella sp. SH-1]|uniref:dihydroorotase n=1 Tax=Terasakiella sp. SH-1 TaxID=2560057 RepID=UPI001074122B|nr:dihydroorotase [Terasakiella sp. SH-1]
MSVKLDKPLGRVAYVNARVIDPASNLDIQGGVLTEGEQIADFGPGYAKANGHYGEATVVDCKGACLVPGLVDMRVQIREPGEEHKGTLQSAGEAATQGGVTSMVSLPNTNPVTDDMSVVEFVARRARLLGLSKVYPYGAITKGLNGKDMAEMGMLAESGAVAFTDGTRAVASAKVMRKALTYARNYDLLLVQHAEEPSLAEGGCMNAGDLAIRMGLAGIPTVAETIMVARDVRLAEDTGGRLHFGHISTAESIDIIRRAKERGVRVTCDTAPPYFSLNELAVGDYRTFAKLSPPLRSEEDRQAIIEGLKDGTIDAIASDHAPEDEDSKRLPFAQAAFGGVGLETLLAITLELYHNKHMSLLECLRTVTCSPADIIGLPAGRLEKGAAADLCVFDPELGWKIDADQLASKSKNSPFDGRLAQGRCLRTVIDGRTVFEMK